MAMIMATTTRFVITGIIINNCIAIGLSSNFFEPMEATNIAYAQVQSLLLAEYLSEEFQRHTLTSPR